MGCLPFILFHLALVPYCQSLDLESTGFSLKLTQTEAQKSTHNFPKTIRPGITRSSFIFTIDAGIGTPSTKRTFIFDPGSELTWTQCTPCINCFQQGYPLFDPRKSKSYAKLPPNHSSARYFRRSNNRDFVYNLLYGTGESSSGIVSIETFSFPSDRKVNESITSVVFGCANNQRGQFRSSVTGIMGMNASPLSLINQMRLKSRNRFSYCLPPIDSHIKTTLLRFGNDVKGRDLRKTSFLNNIDYNYRVPLLGISIAGKRLNLPTGTFRTSCLVDIGCGISYIERHAYTEVVRVVMMHLNRFNLTRINTGSLTEGELCYRLSWGFSSYPNMTFHFQGANYEIGPRSLFRVTNDRFCLAMMGTDNMTILGAFQQQNVRLIYDIGYRKLLFAKEDCTQDKA